ncbi:MAG: hypothetical protein ABJB49_04000 [Nitrospirota bacterium]
MNQLVDPIAVTQFRRQLREALAIAREDWSASRRLVSPDLVCETIERLTAALAGSSLDPGVRDSLLEALLPGKSAGLKGIAGEKLREITGLNPTKAIRNLCVLVRLAQSIRMPVSGMSQQDVEEAVSSTGNPFDLLLTADIASVIDFGAGDLTFEEQLVTGYLSQLEAAGKDLILHCLDRLDPADEASSLVQAGRKRVQNLRQHPSSRLQFRFLSSRDMFAVQEFATVCPRYTIAVCHSPASPTFAYEPSRLSNEAIERRLRETKGEFRRVPRGGRTVLEVLNGDEWLTFPDWKFDVYGPLALLDLLSRNGKLCVLGAVDTEVFWEILSQLLPEDRARPREVFYTEENVRKYFGSIYEPLAQLAVGERTVLKEVRGDIPRVLGPEGKQGERYGFRYVEVRRGALFPGMPTGRTAYVFEQMTREAAPWFLTLVPSV